MKIDICAFFYRFLVVFGDTQQGVYDSLIAQFRYN